MFADEKQNKSIHVSKWPTINEELIDIETEQNGDLIVAVMGEIRRDKAENQKPLNVSVQKLTIYSEDKKALEVLAGAEEDLQGTCKIEKLQVMQTKGAGREVQGYPKVSFVADY